jgi:hypothetical protein
MLLTTGSASAAPSASAGTKTEYLTLVTSAAPSRVMTRSELTNLQSKAVTGVSTAAVPAVVTPYAVASGFVLYNPGYRRSNYVYDSDWSTFTEYRCSGSCVAISQEQTQLHQYVVGGYSRQWQLTLNAKTIFENSGYSHHYSFEYHCAINVSGSPDHYCVDGADPGTSGAMNPGQVLYKYFEYNSYTNTEYPMVKFVVAWSTGDVASFGNRGYDVCTSTSATKLCASSGNGS